MQTLGIIGAGQLGAFLCEAARKLGVRTVVLADREDEMAVRYADHAIVEGRHSPTALAQLASDCDVITFDREDVTQDALTRLTQYGVTLRPGQKIMALLQNKALQKQWILDHNLPTAAFRAFDEGLDGVDLSEFGQKFVIKSQRGGYDGQGVAIVKDGRVPENYENEPCLVEHFVAHQQEVAVLVARSADGNAYAYPVFSTQFDNRGNVLTHVLCPSGLSPRLEQRARQLGVDTITKLDGIGVFAIEMFLTAGGPVINEISPRVHNVGHLTMEAFNVSQFEQHVRAVCGLPLIQPEMLTPAAMRNLLYEPALEPACQSRQSLPRNDGKVHVHWYGKSGRRLFRKMGHLTALSPTAGQARHVADRWLEQLKMGATY